MRQPSLVEHIRWDSFHLSFIETNVVGTDISHARPVCCYTNIYFISSKKPKRAVVRVQRALAISLCNLQRVRMFMTIRHQYTRRVLNHLLDQSPDKISTRPSAFSDSWVMHIVQRGVGLQDPACDAATAWNTGPIDHLSPWVPEVVGLEPVCLRAVEQRCFRASSTLPRLLHLGQSSGPSNPER